MRVLLVNKFWHPKGGSERYTFLLNDLLKAKGHEVVPFAMQDERNLATPWAKHFAPHVDFFGEHDPNAPNDDSNAPNGIRIAQSSPTARGIRTRSSESSDHAFGKLMSVLWNRRAATALDGLLREWKPNVAHLQNFAHQLSPSILPVLKRHGIPVVWTLHDYKLLCPNYRMYTQGSPCERCKGHNFVNALRYNCMGSRGASATVMMEMYLHHALTNVYRDHLDAVISPSAFLAGKLTEWGWGGRNEVLPHLVPPQPIADNRQPIADAQRASVLFVGRLQEEKGVEDVMEAARFLPDIPFEVIGDGPLAVRCQVSGVRCRGALSHKETTQRIASAAMLVVPSRWYENAPYVVLEAMAAGVPVVASRIGGLPELVRDGVTGILVPPRDPATLVNAIRSLYTNPNRARAMGERAQAVARDAYGPDRYYARIMEIYHEVTKEITK